MGHEKGKIGVFLRSSGLELRLSGLCSDETGESSQSWGASLDVTDSLSMALAEAVFSFGSLVSERYCKLDLWPHKINTIQH